MIMEPGMTAQQFPMWAEGSDGKLSLVVGWVVDPSRGRVYPVLAPCDTAGSPTVARGTAASSYRYTIGH
jgi:hypothetical protein